MLNPNMIKTIIVDLDRTLLRTDKTISPYTAEILKECKKSSIGIIVATARPLRAIKHFCGIVDFDAIVVSNGARIICKDQWKEHPIRKKSAERLFRELKRYPDLRITLETGDKAYSNKPIEHYETIISNDLEAVARDENVFKIIVGIETPYAEETVRNLLTKDIYCTVAGGFLLQIMDNAATKMNGIKEVLAIMKISESDAAYFGDDNDDIEPIKACGIGIAVSNAIDEVKAAADHIAKSNDEDGVAKFIEEMILKTQ